MKEREALYRSLVIRLLRELGKDGLLGQDQLEEAVAIVSGMNLHGYL